MEAITITANVKKQSFFFVNSGAFIFCTPEGEQNKICIFDDDITDNARAYANKHFGVDVEGTKEQFDYIHTSKIEFWKNLFDLFIWQYLEKSNDVQFMKQSILPE